MPETYTPHSELEPVCPEAAEVPQQVPFEDDGEIEDHFERYYHLYGEHVSPDWDTGFGRVAVVLGIRRAIDNTRGREAKAAERKQPHAEILQDARNQLEDLTRKQRRQINGLMSQQDASPWLDQALGLKTRRKRKNYVERLTARNKAGKYKVNDELLQNFLEWHNYVLHEEQEKLDKQRPQYDEEFKQHFTEAIEKGWIPESARSNLDRLEDTELVLDDGLRSTRENFAGQAGNYWYGSSHNVYISPDTFKAKKGHVVLHEYLHVTDGMNEDSYFGPMRVRGMHRLFGMGEGGRAMREASTEHLAVSMAHGNIDKINPERRVGEKSTYFKERKLLDVLANKGSRKIDVREFIAANFENNNEPNSEGEQTKGEQLTSQLREAFEFTDVVQEISQLQPGELREYTKKLEKRARRHKVKKYLGINAVASFLKGNAQEN